MMHRLEAAAIASENWNTKYKCGDLFYCKKDSQSAKSMEWMKKIKDINTIDMKYA